MIRRLFAVPGKPGNDAFPTSIIRTPVTTMDMDFVDEEPDSDGAPAFTAHKTKTNEPRTGIKTKRRRNNRCIDDAAEDMDQADPSEMEEETDDDGNNDYNMEDGFISEGEVDSDSEEHHAFAARHAQENRHPRKKRRKSPAKGGKKSEPKKKRRSRYARAVVDTTRFQHVSTKNQPSIRQTKLPGYFRCEQPSKPTDHVVDHVVHEDPSSLVTQGRHLAPRNLMKQTWIESRRPRTLNDIVGQVEAKMVVKSLLDSPHTRFRLMFVGPPGTGKTSMAHMFREHYKVLPLNASINTSIDYLKSHTQKFMTQKSKKPLLVILDEMEQMSDHSQRMMRRLMEQCSKHVSIICITNYPEKVLDAIHSRCIPLRFYPLPADEVTRLLHEITQDHVDRSVLVTLQKLFHGDIRQCVQAVEMLSKVYKMSDITSDKVYEFLGHPRPDMVTYFYKEAQHLDFTALHQLFMEQTRMIPLDIFLNSLAQKITRHWNDWEQTEELLTYLADAENHALSFRDTAEFGGIVGAFITYR